METPPPFKIEPSKVLWAPGEEIPAEIAAIMPDESSIPELTKLLYGGIEPADHDLVRGIVNYRRQLVWSRHLEGFYITHPEYLQR